MQKFTLIITAVILFSSCGLYTKYQTPHLDKEQWLNQDIVSINKGFIMPSWDDFFEDQELIKLIEEGLSNNVDLKVAELNIEKNKALLTNAKLSVLPSFILSPNATISSIGGNKASQSYQLPLTASWEVGVTGKVRNNKLKAKASLEQTEIYVQKVKTDLIAMIANNYFTIKMFDMQLESSRASAINLKSNIRVMKSLKQAGLQTDAAVQQAISNFHRIEISIKDLEKQILQTEHALSILLFRTPGIIERSTEKGQIELKNIENGICFLNLSNRPDVRFNELELAKLYYDTNIARGAFYPSITLKGSIGWSWNGSITSNPADLLISTVGSIAQPIFMQGRNRANLKVAKASYDQARLNYQQTLLKAGNEVNDALIIYDTAVRKLKIRDEQIKALKKAVSETELLMIGGKNTYLEVLTAQDSYLRAKIENSSEWFEALQGKINLFKSLGGYK
ncbi:efflux transporter outer membrane subunit [Halosquirtibacter xylanolyticus]|uniref:efflux transporter outer membrane subunit n=1 Tax=Halosquirtibacter xylanolyticus TaxID=3374599 RepID=UPI0037481CF1|nr:efflux transporter outer membrane subunit [Prolixibacteraceae bacterium]